METKDFKFGLTETEGTVMSDVLKRYHDENRRQDVESIDTAYITMIDGLAKLWLETRKDTKTYSPEGLRITREFAIVAATAAMKLAVMTSPKGST